MIINKKPAILLLASLLLLAVPSLLWAASVELSWQPNTEPDLQGYNVYYGTQTRNYGPPVPVANTTRHTISGLEEAVVYYIALSAVDTSGNESGFSNEISLEVSSTTPSDGLPVVAVTSSGDDGNAAANTIDNDLSTRWSASGNGQWIQYNLGAAFDIDQVSIAFYKGDTRTTDFEIFVSQDANDWNSVMKGSSSGTTLQQENYALANATGRYVRIVGYGNSSNDWNSITEVDLQGVAFNHADTTAPTVTIQAPTENGTYETTASSISVAGTAADDKAVTQISWSTSNGSSGAATGTTSWSTSDIALIEGLNTITVTAADAAGNTRSDSLTVIYTVPDTTFPEIAITSPVPAETFTSSTAVISLAGTAGDDKALQQVTWASSAGESGTASGTTTWSINHISLVPGDNLITVTATDTAGNTAQDTLSITYVASAEGLPVVAVTSSANDGNLAANTTDNDLSTRWSAKGSGQWIQYDLGASFDISQISIAYYRGDTRVTDFEIFVSQNANDWASVYRGQSSGATLQQEDHTLNDAAGHYIRIVGYGNSSNDWNSITEVDISGVPSTVPDTPQDLPVIGITASEDDGNVATSTIDNDLSTRWSARGSGQWVQYDLGTVFNISEIAIAYYQGNARIADFEVFVSQNATDWSTVYRGQSSGSTIEEEAYPVSDARGRFLRIVGYGNSSNDWNSITEVGIVGSVY